MSNRFLEGELSPIAIAYDACIKLHDMGYPLSSSQADKQDAATAPVFFCFTPVARMNPFQRLIYSAAWESGFSTVPIFDLDGVEQFSWPGPMVLHLHWMSHVIGGAVSDQDAKIRMEDFLEQYQRLQDQGYKIMWTVHNIIPHNSVRMDLECELRQRMADIVDIIHVMNRQTVDAVSDYFVFDEKKVIYQPHPSYVGAYPNFISKHEARFDLGLASDDFVITLFGSIQRYKGISEFIDVIDELKHDPQFNHIKIMIVGMPSDKDLVEELEGLYGARDDIILRMKKIPDEMVQYFINASDAVACPYVRTLNSGVGLLALSFGRPIIAPDIGAFRELMEDEPAFGWRFIPGDIDDLKATVERAIKEADPIDEAKILTALEVYSPEAVSKSLFMDIRKML